TARHPPAARTPLGPTANARPRVPLAPIPADAMAVEEDTVEPRPIIRPSIRVHLDRLDALMNLVGELVIARSRLERRLNQFERVTELLVFSQSRMTAVVRAFARQYLDPPLDEAGVAGGPARFGGLGVRRP